MTTSEVMKALSDAGAPFEAILIAVEALEAKDSEIAARDAEQAQKRAKDAERKREARAERKASMDNPRTVFGQSETKKPLNKSFPQTPFKINPKKCPPIVPPFDEKLVEVWNEGAGEDGLTKALPLNRQRKQQLNRRLKEFGEDGMVQAVKKLAASPFHCGDNDRGWKANIGWLLEKSNNVTKALEIEQRQASNDKGDFLAHLSRKTAGS